MEGGCLLGQIDPEAADTVVVHGNVRFDAGTTVDVVVGDEAVWQTRRDEEIPILTWTGSKTGAWSPAAPLPQGWKVRERPGMLFVSYASPGTMIAVE